MIVFLLKMFIVFWGIIGIYNDWFNNVCNMLIDFIKMVVKYIIWYIDDESEMILWDVNGIILKRKKFKKIKILVEYMLNLVKKYM